MPCIFLQSTFCWGLLDTKPCTHGHSLVWVQPLCSWVHSGPDPAWHRINIRHPSGNRQQAGQTATHWLGEIWTTTASLLTEWLLDAREEQHRHKYGGTKSFWMHRNLRFYLRESSLSTLFYLKLQLQPLSPKILTGLKECHFSKNLAH